MLSSSIHLHPLSTPFSSSAPKFLLLMHFCSAEESWQPTLRGGLQTKQTKCNYLALYKPGETLQGSQDILH